MSVSRRLETGGLVADLAARGILVRLRVTGQSMAPFLADGDLVTVRGVRPGEIRVGDLVFVREPQTPPVLHRVVARRPGPGDRRVVVTKGDALRLPDPPVASQHVVGKVVAVDRGGRSREIRLDTLSQRLLGALVALTSLRAPRLLVALRRRR